MIIEHLLDDYDYSGRGAIISLIFCNDELSEYLYKVNGNGVEI